MFDCIIKKKLDESVSKPTSPNSPEHAPYYDVVDPDSVPLPDDNDHVMPDRTTVFDEPITDQCIHSRLNLP